MADVAWRFLRTGSGMLARRLDVRIEGTEHLPNTGPAIIAARHFHHLYDGVVMMAIVPRPLHILVTLDWVRNPGGKLAMTGLCRAASWPVVVRRDDADAAQARRQLRQGLRDALAVLEAGHVLLVFPEGYPNIDPGYTPKQDDEAFLPFQPGFVRLATLAAARGMRVPVVPAGLCYQREPRWQVRLRFGEPHIVQRRDEEDEIRADIEAWVRGHSACADGSTNAGTAARDPPGRY